MEDNMKKRMWPRYADILSNGGFKAFFGDENNKQEVMMLINTLLPEHRRITDIEYRPTELQGPLIGHSKEYQFDFLCRDETGAMFIVEMQRYYEKSWFKRCVSYASRAYDRQNKTGFDYDVPPVWGDDGPCKDFLDALEIEDFSQEKRKQYDKDMYDEKRRNGELAAAREIGHAEGLAEGQAETRIEMAKKLKTSGVDIDTIVQATGLAREAVESL